VEEVSLKNRLVILAARAVVLALLFAMPLVGQACGPQIHSCFGDACLVCSGSGGRFNSCEPITATAHCCATTAYPDGWIEFGSCIYVD
jgi:hypothetical protein